MKKALLLLLFLGSGVLLYAQAESDTLRLTVYDPLSEVSGFAADPDEDEDYSGYFLPAQTGNGSYLPIGQLARQLIGLRFRPRGYDSRWQRHEVNGVELTDPTDGTPYWNMLSAIQIMPTARYDVSGLEPGRCGAGGWGGVTSLSTSDRHIPSSTRLTYARTNRSYSDRSTLAFSKRLGEWLFRGGASYRGGPDGFVTGLDNHRFSGALSLGKNFNGHTLNLLLAAYRSEQGVRSAATQEVYDLAGDNYYNPNWGWQEGKKRNSKNREYTQGLAVLSYDGRLNEAWKASASLSVFVGRNTYSLLTWYDAPTPYPDYYRSLPDFYANPAVGDALREEWRAGNPAVTQIDWGKLYEANRYNTDPNGIARSHYVVRDLVTDKCNAAFSAAVEYRPDKNLSVKAGLRVRSDGSDNYGRMNDLLGGAYWLDIDQYLLDDEYYGGMYQNDVRNPDRPIFPDERFGYSYRMRSTTVKAWSTVDYQTARYRIFAGAEVGSIGFRRDGRYEKEMFPGNRSFGRSESVNFTEYTLKAGAFYHFSLRHRIGVQASAAATAPLVKNIFVAPSYRNETLADPAVIRVAGAELVYEWVSPQFALHLTGYLTRFRDDAEIRNFYDDVDGEYMNLALTGIDKVHAGAECSVEWNVTPRLSLLGVLSAGVFKYDNDPLVTLYRDSDGSVRLTGATAHLSGYRLPGTPQTAGMLQLNYRTRSYWRFELSGKYTADNYVSLNPVRRMNRALDAAGSPEIQRQMAAQERLDNAFLLSLSVSKSFRLRNGSRIGLWANVDNLLNDKSIRFSGYEQWRFTKTSDGAGRTLRPFPSKYLYAYGANYYAMLSYTF